MASSLNKVMIIGNLTQDPELKQIGSGTSVCSFGVATNRTWKDASGEKQEQAEFHSVVAWAKLAEIINQYLKKGNRIYIEGRLQTRNWEGQDGVKRYKTEIVAENMVMLGGRADSSGFTADASTPAPTETAESQPSSDGEIKLEDIPF